MGKRNKAAYRVEQAAPEYEHPLATIARLERIYGVSTRKHWRLSSRLWALAANFPDRQPLTQAEIDGIEAELVEFRAQAARNAAERAADEARFEATWKKRWARIEREWDAKQHHEGVSE